MENQLSTVLNAGDIRNQVNLIQSVMKEIMQENQHYGKIPGCGDKPTLLKPGAEKLSMVFKLRPIINNGADVRIDHISSIDYPIGHREVTVYCHVFNMDGVELSTGVGSCSTLESKYRYRGGEKVFIGQPCPTEYWNLKKAGKYQEAKEKIGGEGRGVAKNPENGQWEICELGEKMENPDIADTYNTVLKMAKKRAYVDGILSATGASDIFTQDIEDMNPADVKAPVTPPNQSSKPEVATPQEKKYADLITMAQSKKGDKMNVSCYVIASEYKEVPHKTDKSKKFDITNYSVGDLPKDPTITAVISAFEKPGMYIPGDRINFNDVAIGEYQGKPQYTAKESVKHE